MRPIGAPPVLPIFLTAELQDVAHLSTPALGAHWRLTYWSWTRNGAGPADDDALLARIVRVRPSQWRAIRDELLTVWDVTGGRWQHDRLTLTIAEANRKRIANQANGGNGGRAKSLKYKGRTIADATDPPSDDMPKTYPRYERDNLSVPDGTERGYPVADALQPPSPWDQVKGTFDAARRSAWLDQLVFAGVDDGSVVLLAPTRFVADWVGTNLGVDICRGFAAAGMAVRGIAVSVATSVNIAPASPAEASNHPSGGAAGSAGRGGRQ